VTDLTVYSFPGSRAKANRCKRSELTPLSHIAQLDCDKQDEVGATNAHSVAKL